ncbi:MAG: diguanylate cyclase [Desulfomicrobium sp.]|nr:diguanylate cyclase [Desulfomicrobium sp.]
MSAKEVFEGTDVCFDQTRRYEILREIFDSLSEHVAVLDREGCIVDTNLSWKRFAQDNSLSDQCRLQGENYIEVCDSSRGASAGEAQHAASGIRAVLSGEIPEFSLEYPCHSPRAKRWFLMTVTPLVSHGAIDGAVVSHIQITTRKLAEMALVRYERAIASSSALVSIISLDFVYLLVNESYLTVHGKRREEIEGHKVPQIVDRNVFEQFVKPNLERCFAGETVQFEACLDTKGAGKRCYAVTYYPYRERDESISGAVVTATDITEAKKMQEEIASSARRLSEAQRLAKVGSFEKDYVHGAKSWSEEFCRILGYEPEGVDPDFNLFMLHIHPEDEPAFKENFEAAQVRAKDFSTELRIRTVQGEEKHVSLICGFDFLEDGSLYRLHGAMADVTERRLAELRLERLANTDELTGLPNRRYFLDLVRAEMVRSRRYGKSLCVAMVDIDDFKKVNDVHGHGVGDLALRHVAGTLMETRRAVDVVGRLGGEEFCILFPETGLAAGEVAAARVVKGLADSVLEHEGLRLRLTVSMGLVECEAAEGLDELLKRSDDALYEAKRAGKNRVCCGSAKSTKTAGPVAGPDQNAEAI